MSDTDDLTDAAGEPKTSTTDEPRDEPRTEGTTDENPEPLHVESQSHLETLVAEHEVVLVDFHADWCGPCQMLEPVVEEIAAETSATVAKVDIDELQGLAQAQGIRGVPTLLLYADGELVERMVGVQEKSTLVGLVEQHG